MENPIFAENYRYGAIFRHFLLSNRAFSLWKTNGKHQGFSTWAFFGLKESRARRFHFPQGFNSFITQAAGSFGFARDLLGHLVDIEGKQGIGLKLFLNCLAGGECRRVIAVKELSYARK